MASAGEFYTNPRFIYEALILNELISAIDFMVDEGGNIVADWNVIKVISVLKNLQKNII